MTTTYSTNKQLALQGTGDNSGTWGAVLNSSVFQILDSNLGGQTAVTINTADVTLTQTQANSLIQTLTGTLTGNRNLIFPASQGGFWVIENGTSGSFSVTCKNSGGTGVAIPQGYQSLIYLNGTTNVAYMVGTNSPISFGNINNSTILGNNTGSSAAPLALTAAQVNTLLGCAVLNTAESFTAAQRGTPVVLTDVATVTPDFSLGNNFSLLIGGNRTLANPSSQIAGQGGQIIITQDGTGNRTLIYGSNWKFPSGTTPTLTTTAGAVDVLSYYVESSSRITTSMLNDVK